MRFCSVDQAKDYAILERVAIVPLENPEGSELTGIILRCEFLLPWLHLCSYSSSRYVPSSVPEWTPTRKLGPAPSNRRPATLGQESPENKPHRSHFLGFSIPPLARLALDFGSRSAGNGCGLGIVGGSLVLDLEGSTGTARRPCCHP